VFLAQGPDPRGAARSIFVRSLSSQRSTFAHDLVHLHGEVAATLCLPALALRPSVLTLHGLNVTRRSTGVSRAAAALDLRVILRAASKTICVSEAERDEVIEAAGPAAARRAVVIHNGVGRPASVSAEERAAIREELDLPPEAVVGIWVGGLETHKDPYTAVLAAVEASRSDPRLTLLIAGTGPLHDGLLGSASAARDGAVRVLGFRTDVSRLLAAADFFVLTSLHEGLSYSLLEAMAVGLPSVVSDPPGNTEAAGDAAITVRCGDVSGFAAAFQQLAGDEQKRSALGAQARARVEEHFRIEEMGRRTGELYDAVLRGR
jgi:glycosyltransferase involved in cell wall biosynthesis